MNASFVIDNMYQLLSNVLCFWRLCNWDTHSKFLTHSKFHVPNHIVVFPQ